MAEAGGFPVQRTYRAASGFPTSAKTVHRTVFLRKFFDLLPPCSTPNHTKTTKTHHKGESLLFEL